MRIKVTDIQDNGKQEIVIDGTCDYCFAYGVANNQYEVTFQLTMKSGQSFDVKADELFNIDDIKNEGEDIDEYLESRSISNIFRFSKALESLEFPDLVFCSTSEWEHAIQSNDGSVAPVIVYRMVTGEMGIKFALNVFIYRVIKAYVSDEDGLSGLKEYIASLPQQGVSY